MSARRVTLSQVGRNGRRGGGLTCRRPMHGLVLLGTYCAAPGPYSSFREWCHKACNQSFRSRAAGRRVLFDRRPHRTGICESPGVDNAPTIKSGQSYPNRFFGFGLGWLPAEISARISCASLASLNSRRRAMLARTSAALFAISSRAFAPSSAASRCRVIRSTFGSLVSSDTLAPMLLAHKAM